MLGKDILAILVKAIPIEATEHSYIGEPYGAYGVDLEKDYKKILYCVSATREVEEYFYKHEYDLIISHHPFPCRCEATPQMIFHTALDFCKDGLNDLWADYLGVTNRKPFYDNVGVAGTIEPIEYEKLLEKVKVFADNRIEGVAFSKRKVITSVAICTGLGGFVATQAEAMKTDCYILGQGMGKPRSYKFPSVIETGHTASESVGVLIFRKLLPDLQIDLAPYPIDNFGSETVQGVRYDR
jgi:putative NIF3 family GTP cyclohydrolase 1 type 2